MIAVWILAVCATVSLLCIVHVWQRAGATLSQRLLWSCLLWLPILGPLFYASLFEPLKPSGYREQWPTDRGGIPPGGEF
jgi:hypothetical protein